MSNSHSVRPRIVFVTVTLALLSCLGFGQARSAGVTAQLRVPRSEVYVIGDDIPLLWQFMNQEPDPLAFLWEGCCRLNGRLDVKRDDRTLTPIPPGSSLAHQFARAEVLEPGTPGEFKTLLSDWVKLDRTGRYLLQGRYMGVMPTQQPQVPASIQLWRGETTTDPITLTVLSPTDYLAERDQRSEDRGLRLTLEGPSAFPPLGSVPVTITFENLDSEPLSLFWPGPVQLWFLNERDERVGIRFLDQPVEELTIPGQSQVQRSFLLHADELLDAPFGVYRVFVDYAAEGPQVPRVPSNALTMDWSLSLDQVKSLVAEAAEGPNRGARNPALKRLRVYLDQIRDQLKGVDATSLGHKGEALAQELTLASCLKSFASIPGLVDFRIGIDREGGWTLRDEGLNVCVDQNSAGEPEQLESILSVRRHLGWSIQLMAEPTTGAMMGDIFHAVEALASFAERLSGPISARVVLPEIGVTNRVGLRTDYVPANVVVRLAGNGSDPSLEVARRLPDPAKPAWIIRFAEADLSKAVFTKLNDAAALESWLTRERIEAPQISVLASRQLTWAQTLQLTGPLLRRGWSFELMAVN